MYLSVRLSECSCSSSRTSRHGGSSLVCRSQRRKRCCLRRCVCRFDLACTSNLCWSCHQHSQQVCDIASFPGHIGEEKVAWYQLLVHVQPFPVYFRKIVRFTLSVHMDYIWTKYSRSSLHTCTHTQSGCKAFCELCCSKYNPGVPLFCSVIQDCSVYVSTSCIETAMIYQHIATTSVQVKSTDSN